MNKGVARRVLLGVDIKVDPQAVAHRGDGASKLLGLHRLIQEGALDQRGVSSAFRSRVSKCKKQSGMSRKKQNPQSRAKSVEENLPVRGLPPHDVVSQLHYPIFVLDGGP